MRLVLAASGLRFGLDLTLMNDDTRISQWAADGNGMIWDLVLFALTYVLFFSLYTFIHLFLLMISVSLRLIIDNLDFAGT